ncbi:MAG: arsenite methyltransferase [Armatimonadetes bacterium]|nr:arsenite methyltransferase [Armatimonadota bacterium]
MANDKLVEREDVRELVKRKYGEAALRVLNGQGGACCSPGADEVCCGTKSKAEDCCSNAPDPITSNLYSEVEAAEIPEAAILASLGCGNPTALAQLNTGEIVLDLGSGGGIDVLLSARRVGPTGFAYGLDMTDEMLELAEKNKAEASAQNVEFLKGHIENIPLPDNTVDVVISNCVINLSADKDQVLREALRVLKPGGRFAVSDVVVEGDLPEPVRKDMELYVGCVAGALERNEYLEKLIAAGFTEASIEPIRRYQFSAIEGTWAPKGVQHMSEEAKKEIDGKIMGAFIRAVKPS